MLPLTFRARFALLASVTVAFLAASSALTPLYPRYASEWALSSLDITVLFGVYAVAVLFSLLFLGRLSDHIGRRPVLIVSLAVQLAAMAGFALADGYGALLFARTLQGLSTGAAVAAVGAGLLDIDRVRGAVANSVIVPIGTAAGGLVAGFVVGQLPAPTQLIYLLLAVIFVAQAAGIAFMGETGARRGGAVASLRPQLSVGRAMRAHLLRAVPIIIATWAVPGFFGSLGPSLMQRVLDLDTPLASGMLMFTLAGSAGVSVLLSHRFTPHQLTTLGASSLAIGLALITVGLELNVVIPFFVGAAIAGLGFGSGFQGALRSVLEDAPPAERAGVLSVVFIIAYTAMGAPAMLAGWLATLDGDLLMIAREFAGLILVLASLALGLATLRRINARATGRCRA